MEPIQKKSNSTMYVVTGLIIVVIVAVLVLSGNKKDAMENVVAPGVEDTTIPTDSGVGTIDPNKEGTSISNAGKYADLMLKYKDTMVQFNQECAVVSNKVTFKQGTDILLDNRDNTAAKILIGSRTFNLPAYGYKVIDLPTVGSFQLDCNKRLNVVTVSVQK